MPTWSNLSRAGLWALLLTLPVYAVGVYRSPLLTPRSVAEVCGIKPMADPATQESFLPLKYRCLWQDGTTTDLVPGAFNQVLLLLVGTAAILLLLGLWAFVRAHSCTLTRRGRATMHDHSATRFPPSPLDRLE